MWQNCLPFQLAITAMLPLRVTVLSLSLLSAAHAAYCGGRPDPNAQPNAYPIDASAPRFSHSVKNGHAYMAGPPGAEFRVMHLYGSAYVRLLCRACLAAPR